jgi:hypothetical protein
MNPTLAIVIVVALGLVAVAAIVFGIVLLVRSLRQTGTRRTVISLIGRKEAILVSYKALWNVVQRLAEASDEELALFNEDPADEERRAFEEVASRMRITDDELKSTEVPRPLETVAMTMEDAARLIFEAASSVDGAGESDALTAAGEIDFQTIADAIGRMETELHEAAERYHVDDSSVMYGGGLYI